MTIDPDSHLFLHHQQQRERERRLQLVLALRNADDVAGTVPSATSRLPVVQGLLGSLRGPSLRGPTAAGGAPGGVGGR